MLDEVSLETCPRPQFAIDRALQQEALNKFQLTAPLANSQEAKSRKTQSQETASQHTAERTAIGMCPGAEFGPAKRWPDEYYAEVAQSIIDNGQQVWLFGSAKDREVTERIKHSLSAEAQAHCFNLAGNTSLTEAVYLLAACDTVISNDSGLMHVSAAVGCKIIAIYGSSSPEYTPPLSDRVEIVNTDIECRPCFKRECPLGHMNCLKQLTPSVVTSLLKSQL
jgi:heptosyltransferase-2